MDKVIKDGKVAVLISTDYGGGWSSWGDEKDREALLFHPELVKMVLDGRRGDINDDLVEKILGDGASFYSGNSEDLEVEWVPKGTRFRVNEYDGSETVEFFSEKSFPFVA